MSNAEILTQVRNSAAIARGNEAVSIDARARCFIATLAGMLYESDAALAAEFFAVLVNVPAMQEVPCKPQN